MAIYSPKLIDMMIDNDELNPLQEAMNQEVLVPKSTDQPLPLTDSQVHISTTESNSVTITEPIEISPSVMTRMKAREAKCQSQAVIDVEIKDGEVKKKRDVSKISPLSEKKKESRFKKVERRKS